MSLSHSTWPVIVVPYNLAPCYCMKKEFNMLCLLIPGPNSPGRCLDVYLRPLIDELNKLWKYGVKTYDRHTHTEFRMKAALMWTISDFPAYGMLSAHTTKGYYACPLCLDGVHSEHHCGKTVFMGSRKWLDGAHSWRTDKDAFDGKEEHGMKPKSGLVLKYWKRLVSMILAKSLANMISTRQ